ncbi:hypothetical protein MMC07_007191 [Pseudocyphellaria aurata]|nr:hypothetical protein [Pseudocyphellaria aurata]
MNVLQTVLLSLLGLLCFPFATALTEDDQRGEGRNRWVDMFSTLACSCTGWQNTDGTDHHGHHSGDYFGISYYNREFDRLYNWTALEVRNPGPHHLHRHRHWQPHMDPKCVTNDDGTELCYGRYGAQGHARYSYEGYLRRLPEEQFHEMQTHPATDECRTICPEVVKLPLVSATSCRRAHYKMRMICPGHSYGECEDPYLPWRQ